MKLVQEHDDDDETDSKDCKLGRSQEQVLTSTNTSAMEHRKENAKGGLRHGKRNLSAS